MEKLFLTILDMSITASWVIAAVVVIRLLLRKAPRKWSYLLWSVVAFRLCCPISFQSAFSLFTLRPGSSPAMTPLPDYLPESTPTYILPATQTAEHTSTLQHVSWEMGSTAFDWLTAITVIWCVGMAALLIISTVSYIKLCLEMTTAMRLEGNVYQSDRVRSPFLLGFAHPRIYIPFRLSEETLRYVLAHERYHIRRLDHLVKLFAFLLLTLHWFNPLCWLAFQMMNRDMEMSCDEKVLASERNIRKAYSASLLSFASNQRFPAPSPLAFSESDIKCRIKNVLRWKQPKAWMTTAAAILCVAAVTACAADPVQSGADNIDGKDQSGDHVGKYASMEDYSQAYTRELKSVSYYTTASTPATASVTNTKVQWLDQLGQVQGLHPEGTLEVWEFQYLIQVDAKASDILLAGGMQEKNGWYDLEGHGGYILVALRYPDSSYDVLHIEPYNDAMSFKSYHSSWSEALADWYVKESQIDYPLYVDTLFQKNHTVHPGKRFTGPGWYFYLPVSGWELTSARTWSSSYGTGATLTVQELSVTALEQMELRLGEGWVVTETDRLCVKHPTDAVMEYYYDKTDGGCCQVRISWNTSNWWDSNYQISEVELLQSMARSFTVNERVNSANIANFANKLVFKSDT